MLALNKQYRQPVIKMRNEHRSGQRRNNRDRPDPLLSVEWCRVIDHPETDAAIVASAGASLVERSGRWEGAISPWAVA